MDEKIKSLWQNNKILFFLLIPLILLWFGRNLLISLLVSSGNKVVGDSSKKSEELKQAETIANTKADQIIQDADQNAAKKPVVGEDWNK
jgi:hypothetical protein